MFDPYRKRREKAAHIREMRMGAVDFSLPVDGDIPSLRRPSSQAGDFMDSLVEDLTRDRSTFFDEVVSVGGSFFRTLTPSRGNGFQVQPRRVEDGCFSMLYRLLLFLRCVQNFR